MSSYSSSTSSSSSNSTSSEQKHHLSVGISPGGSDHILDIFPQTAASTASATAFPSWPRSGNMLSSPSGRSASSYISDEDLLDLLDDGASSMGFLTEAPAPPRQAHQWVMGAQHEAPQPVANLPLPRTKVHFRKSPKKSMSSTSRRPSNKAMPAINEASM